VAGRRPLPPPYSEPGPCLGLALQAPWWQTIPAFDCGTADLLAACARQGLEGIVAKRTASFYYPGRRSPDWVKVKPVTGAPNMPAGGIPTRRPAAADRRCCRYRGQPATRFEDWEVSLVAERVWKSGNGRAKSRLIAGGECLAYRRQRARRHAAVCVAVIAKGDGQPRRDGLTPPAPAGYIWPWRTAPAGS
jgi:hypothetical protein